MADQMIDDIHEAIFRASVAFDDPVRFVFDHATWKKILIETGWVFADINPGKKPLYTLMGIPVDLVGVGEVANSAGWELETERQKMPFSPYTCAECGRIDLPCVNADPRKTGGKTVTDKNGVRHDAGHICADCFSGFTAPLSDSDKVGQSDGRKSGDAK